MALFVEEVDERSNQTTNNLILISWGEKDDDDDELLQQHRNAIYKIFLGSNLYFADNNLEFSTGEDSEFKFVQSKINKLTQPILSTCKETFFENKIKNSINNCDFILFFESDQDLHVKNVSNCD